ncbi:MAG: dynamin family protein, partial [Elusimicrobia bacterium]|nr:dynamin family protein [Elusimicrobiota bacterium]
NNIFYTVDEIVLRNILSKYFDEELYIAFVGGFSSGKSTLINSLLGEKILPSKILPTTAKNTYIRYGRNKCRITYSNNRVREVAPCELCKFCEGEENIKDISDILVRHPSSLLEGVTLIDSPGTQSLYEKHSSESMNLLPLVDIVLYVLDVGKPFSDDDRKGINLLKEYHPRIIFVVNQVDRIINENPGKIKMKIAESIKSTTGIKQPHILMTSGKNVKKNPDLILPLVNLILESKKEKYRILMERLQNIYRDKIITTLNFYMQCYSSTTVCLENLLQKAEEKNELLPAYKSDLKKLGAVIETLNVKLGRCLYAG